ncbi:PRAME family member 8-like [Sigmodon hispidus]
MDYQNPSSLQQLAIQSMLRDEALAINALQHLPRVLFPPLFKEAFTGRYMKILKATVAAWPFPCLPVGFLMKTPDLVILKAVLDGLDMLLTQAWRRWCKLKVVDFQTTHHNCWQGWAGVEDSGCTPEAIRKKQTLEDLPVSEGRQSLKIIVDLCLKFYKLDEYHTYLLHWVKPRKSSLQLCCGKLQVWVLPVYTIIEILKVFESDCIQELELNSWWHLGALTWFAPYLGQMINLRKFSISGVYENMKCVEKTFLELEYINKFISQFSKLKCLQHLYMNQVNFLTGQMQHLVWCLKSPLETLSITFSLFTQSDLNHLSQCQSLWHLKHLNLSGIPLYHLCFKPIQDLLESVTTTLQTLELEECKLEDSHISVLLPILSQCSQLTKVNFNDNYISMPILKDLLHHTANLSQLTHELYPAPLKCYDYAEIILDRFNQLCPQLMNTLRAIRQPRKVVFGAEVCSECDVRCIYDTETRLCPCRQSD